MTVVLYIDGELYVTFTTEGPHNGKYCQGGIFHHIEKQYPKEPAFDLKFGMDCTTSVRARNLTDPYKVIPATEIPEDSRLCLKCAKVMADGRHTVDAIDSAFDIPDYRPPTIDGFPVRRFSQLAAYGSPDIRVMFDPNGEEWTPIETVFIKPYGEEWRRTEGDERDYHEGLVFQYGHYWPEGQLWREAGVA